MKRIVAKCFSELYAAQPDGNRSAWGRLARFAAMCAGMLTAFADAAQAHSSS